MWTEIWITEVLMLMTGVAGYFIGKLGLKAVIADIESLKSKVSPSAQPTPPTVG